MLFLPFLVLIFSRKKITIKKMSLKCRFYEQTFPKVKDEVMVRVKVISDESEVKADLLEYPGVEGVILDADEMDISTQSRQERSQKVSKKKSKRKTVEVREDETFVVPAVVVRAVGEKGRLELSRQVLQ